ncbi:MAG: hypothetical protein LBR39_02940 [Coriobacteriales bacterium]|nr:hypothetical protein [Coriobacteriales bacterium]
MWVDVDIIYDVIIGLSTTIGALAVITTTFVALKKRVFRWLGREVIELLEKGDIPTDSYLGGALAWNDTIEEKLSQVSAAIEENHMTSMKNELMLAINLHPEKVEVIEGLYGKYTERGGNSYMDLLIHEWRKMYAKSVIQERISKKGGNQ